MSEQPLSLPYTHYNGAFQINGEVDGPFTVPSKQPAINHNIHYSESVSDEAGMVTWQKGVVRGMAPFLGDRLRDLMR